MISGLILKKIEMNCVAPDMIDLAVTVCNRYAAG